MVITFKVDGKLVVLTAIYLAIGIAALLLAFPDMSVWVPGNSSEMASWVQAIGSILAIFFAGHQVSRQINFSKSQSEAARFIKEAKFVSVCKDAVSEACDCLENIYLKFRYGNRGSPAESLDEVEHHIDVLKMLVSSKDEVQSLFWVFIVMKELLKAKAALKFYEEIEDDLLQREKLYRWSEEQTAKSKESFERSQNALLNLTKIYKSLDI